MELVEKGKSRAKELLPKELQAPVKEASQPPPAQTLTPQPLLPGEEDTITKLSRQVQSLKEKDSMLRAQAASTQKPREVKRVGTKTVFNYSEGAIFTVHAGVDRITDIELQAGESLTSPPVSGDTVRWKISLAKSGKRSMEKTHLILKPLETDIETNFILTTDKHTYHIRALSSDWYMPSVSWNYPQEESAEYQEMLRKENTEEPLVISADNLNFDYEVDGDSYPWKPLRAFDDGAKTYLQMPRGMRSSEAPVLFVIDSEEDEPALVNYRVKGDYYIADRLFEKAELRVGKNKSVTIEKTEPSSFFARLFGL